MSRNHARCRTTFVTLAAGLLAGLVPFASAIAQPTDCDPDDGGLTLPDGFCAQVVADDLGRARHLVVAPNGDIYVAIRGGSDGGVVALRDTDFDGTADVIERFGHVGGTGIALNGNHLYLAADDAILRYYLEMGELTPAAGPDTIVSGLPAARSHAAKTTLLGPDGSLFVNVGAPSNACQVEDREAGSPGQDPCPELETRGGVWRFQSQLMDQTQADGELYATGLRNTFALAFHPDGALYGLQHGRDQLHQNWPELFTVEDSAEKPSEELVRIEQGDDFGWPYCYHDPELDTRVLAPEYGGDGRAVERCADAKAPAMAFPAHWGPNAILFYTGEQFPAPYRGGAFIAFHGSWNRAPLPQGGYNVVFAPFSGDEPEGNYEVFADGFAGADVSPRGAEHRPAGLALGPDGSLYISDDKGGRIWRVTYTGS